jgi:hypothetical protein
MTQNANFRQTCYFLVRSFAKKREPARNRLHPKVAGEVVPPEVKVDPVFTNLLVDFPSRPFHFRFIQRFAFPPHGIVPGLLEFAECPKQHSKIYTPDSSVFRGAMTTCVHV